MADTPPRFEPPASLSPARRSVPRVSAAIAAAFSGPVALRTLCPLGSGHPSIVPRRGASARCGIYQRWRAALDLIPDRHAADDNGLTGLERPTPVNTTPATVKHSRRRSAGLSHGARDAPASHPAAASPRLLRRYNCAQPNDTGSAPPLGSGRACGVRNTATPAVVTFILTAAPAASAAWSPPASASAALI
jgi:hypothetical protein